MARREVILTDKAPGWSPAEAHVIGAARRVSLQAGCQTM